MVLIMCTILMAYLLVMAVILEQGAKRVLHVHFSFTQSGFFLFLY